MKQKKSAIIILSLIFLLAFSIKIMPLYKGYNIPFGYVDTAFHVSSALDISESNFKSMVHPWWHVRNHILIDGYDVVDRNAASLFYPPLIHLILAFFFLFMNPGSASVIVISLLYSLSVPAAFFLCKSFGFKDKYALVSAALAAISVPLLSSQNYGFWTFAIASNFIILSYSFLRFKVRKFTILSIIFYFLALTTHWAFFPAAIIIGLAEFFIGRNKEANIYIFSAVLIAIPFLVYISYLHSPFDYAGTYFRELAIPNYIFITLGAAGLLLNFKKYREMLVFSFLSFFIFALFYFFGMKLIFADMIQFIFPFIVAFYIGALFQNINKKNIKHVFAIILLAAVISDFMLIKGIFDSSKPSITSKDFNNLLELRNEFKPDETTIIAADRGLLPWWITVVSKNSKIIYPDTYENENLKEYRQNYILNETKTAGGYTFYRIAKKGDKLVLEKNAALPKKIYGFGY